jgi:hypothetical protein
MQQQQTQDRYPVTVTIRRYNDPAYLVDLVMDTVTVGDIGRLPDGIAERAMRAWLRIIANVNGHTSAADARYIELAMVRYGLWEVSR